MARMSRCALSSSSSRIIGEGSDGVQKLVEPGEVSGPKDDELFGESVPWRVSMVENQVPGSRGLVGPLKGRLHVLVTYDAAGSTDKQHWRFSGLFQQG